MSSLKSFQEKGSDAAEDRCGRDFGSPSRGVLGIADGNDGVQWNAGYRPGDGFVWLGVNLEGMKYND